MNAPAPVLRRLALAAALALAPAYAAGRAVPAGFEDLVMGQVEQLDIRLFARSAGVSPVLVTLETVQFLDPAGVLEALGLSPAARTALLPAFSAPLPRNSQHACRHPTDGNGCGYLQPPDEPHGVRALYDESEGAVRVFVAQQWLPQHPARERLHTVSTRAENAFLHQHMLSVSGGDGYQALTAQGTGTLGIFDHAHAAVNWNFSRQRYQQYANYSRFELDSAYYRHDLHRAHYLQAGRMDRRNLSSTLGGTFGFALLPVDRFDGVRVGTTQAYVDAEAAVHASPLNVLLVRDTRVDVFDGERLLQTFYLQAGINALDTRAFPFGRYTLTLRLYENGVLVRSEDAFFEKGGDRTDEGVQWFAQAGRSAPRHGWGSEAHAQGSTALAGARLALGRHVAMTAGVADMSHRQYAELRFDLRRAFATQEVRAGISALRGSDGSHGIQHQLSYRRHAAWNLHQQRLRGTACHVQNDTRSGLGCLDSLSASVALPLAGGSVYIGHTRRQAWRTAGLPADTLPGMLPPLLPVPRPGLQTAQRSRAWQASYSRLQRWGEFSMTGRGGLWQQRDDVPLGARDDRGAFIGITVTRLQRQGHGSSQRRYAVDLRQPAHATPQVSVGAGQTLRREQGDQATELSADLRGSNAEQYTASLSGLLQNRFGQTSAALAHYTQRGGGSFAYSGTHSAGIALGTQGLYWGATPGPGADAGLAINVDGVDDLDLSGVAAELLVSGHRRQRLRLGERRLLPLMAYQPHEADVQDASALDSVAAIRVGSPTGSRSLFLSPGRMIALPVALEVTYTYIGNARDIAGVPLQGARILNAPVPATGGQGGFVAELPRREDSLFLLQGDQLLQCPLQVRERRQVLLLVGAVRCTQITVAQLPAHVREQIRVTRLLQDRALIPRPDHTAGAGQRP